MEWDSSTASFVDEDAIWQWRTELRVTWLKHSLHKRDGLGVIPVLGRRSFSNQACDVFVARLVLPISASEDDLFVDLACVWVLRVVDNHWPPKAIGILAHLMGVVPICAWCISLLDRVSLLSSSPLGSFLKDCIPTTDRSPTSREGWSIVS